MAHPMQKFRQSNVERARVPEIIKGYASGGAAKSKHHSAPMKKMHGKDLGSITGEMAKHRADKPRRRAEGGQVQDGSAQAQKNTAGNDSAMARLNRASGGKVGKKATTVVNVITQAPQPPAEAPPMPMPPPAAMAPPPPPPGPPPGGPPPGAGLAGPGGPPPGMPMRARGGGVKSVGMNVGTHVQHDKGKNDLGDIRTKRPVTFAAGGKVVKFDARVPLPKPRPEGSSPQPSDLYAPDQVKTMETQRAKGGRISSPAKGGMGPKMHGGAGSAEGRLEKTRDAS